MFDPGRGLAFDQIAQRFFATDCSDNQIFNEFSSGMRDATAIKQFLRMFYDIIKFYDYNKIIWGFEFIDENTIIFTDKRGKIFKLKR